MKRVKSSKSQRVISEDVVLMFDEMYLHKCEEYCGSEINGANENSELYKGLLSFMIVRLKENFPYIIKSVPEQNSDSKRIKEQILESVKTLKNCDFRVRSVVSDIHSANVIAYMSLLKECSHLYKHLFIEHDYQKIYLLHDAYIWLKT